MTGKWRRVLFWMHLVAGLCAAIPVVVLPLVAFGRNVRRRSRFAQDTLADATAYAHRGSRIMVNVATFYEGDHECNSPFGFYRDGEVYVPNEGYRPLEQPRDQIRLSVLKKDEQKVLWQNDEAVLLDLGDGACLSLEPRHQRRDEQGGEHPTVRIRQDAPRGSYRGSGLVSGGVSYGTRQRRTSSIATGQVMATVLPAPRWLRSRPHRSTSYCAVSPRLNHGPSARRGLGKRAAADGGTGAGVAAIVDADRAAGHHELRQ